MDKVLYLHIGWSKTGTSAIQKKLNDQFNQLKAKGVLYSKIMQMNDHAHHHFALAFQPIYGYPAQFNGYDAMEALDKEMGVHNCKSLIISSELSPFYFSNPKFKKWTQRFDRIEVIATVRHQSEVLLSLFNQLVKDPMVRYKGTFFQLAISNFPKVNYFQQLNKWGEVVGHENVKVIKYSKNVVSDFSALFELGVVEGVEKEIINPSLPNQLLQKLQDETKGINDPDDYRRIRDTLISMVKVNNGFSGILITKGELKVIDEHFNHSNKLAANKYLNNNKLFEDKEYHDVEKY